MEICTITSLPYVLFRRNLFCYLIALSVCMDRRAHVHAQEVHHLTSVKPTRHCPAFGFISHAHLAADGCCIPSPPPSPSTYEDSGDDSSASAERQAPVGTWPTPPPPQVTPPGGDGAAALPPSIEMEDGDEINLEQSEDFRARLAAQLEAITDLSSADLLELARDDEPMQLNEAERAQLIKRRQAYAELGRAVGLSSMQSARANAFKLVMEGTVRKVCCICCGVRKASEKDSRFLGNFFNYHIRSSSHREVVNAAALETGKVRMTCGVPGRRSFIGNWESRVTCRVPSRHSLLGNWESQQTMC